MRSHRINLPQGGYTHLTVDEYKVLLENVVEGGTSSRARRLFDHNRMSNRWSGQTEQSISEAERVEMASVIETNNKGFGWKNGPPVVGDGEGELPVDVAHISGRIFGEDAFAALAGEEEGEEDVAGFFDVDVEQEGSWK